VENDPSEGIRDHQWKMTLDPTEGIMYGDSYRLTPRRGNYGIDRMTPTVEMTMAEISEALGKNVKVVK
jgi:hypothetical protein